MAYVRKRTTKAGSVSTTLVEAYRDENGRSRQRILVNLYGEPTVVTALAKLWVQHQFLSEQLDELTDEMKETYRFCQKAKAAHDGKWAKFGSQLDRQHKRFKAIETALERMERDYGILIKHCDASDEEVNAAAQAFVKRRADAANTVLGMMWLHSERKREVTRILRRITT
jgi:hypothetical protein